jgi:hypothetical protein
MELPVLVTNLSFETTQATLESALGGSGHVFLAVDQETSKSRGFALVLLAESQIDAFVTKYEGATIDSRKIRLNPMAAASAVVGMWISNTPDECPERVRAALRAQAQRLAE